MVVGNISKSVIIVYGDGHIDYFETVEPDPPFPTILALKCGSKAKKSWSARLIIELASVDRLRRQRMHALGGQEEQLYSKAGHYFDLPLAVKCNFIMVVSWSYPNSSKNGRNSSNMSDSNSFLQSNRRATSWSLHPIAGPLSLISNHQP